MSAMAIVVTGCTQGLGLNAVKTLAAKPSEHIIVLACRNVEAARAAAQRLVASRVCESSRLVVLPEKLDLSDLSSVRAYVAALKEFLRGGKGIVSLVNNAGIGGNPSFRKSKQDFEEIWATNHLGHFLLTLLCLPLMAQHGRIVNVSSEVHDPATKTPLPDPGQHWPSNAEEYDAHLAGGLPVGEEDAKKSGMRRYSRSKLCNIFFTYELARLLSGAAPHGASAEAVKAMASASGGATCLAPHARSIGVIAMNPGLMLDTNFCSASSGAALGMVAWLLTPALRCTSLGALMRTGPQSGAALAELAVGELAHGGETAAYYDGTKLHKSSSFSLSVEAVKHYGELWKHSLRWAQVTPEELAAAGFR